MLIPLDEYPIHQAPTPLAHPISGDPNHYDRYFFHGYDLDQGIFFGATFARYPTRGSVDAAVSVAVDGVQHSLFASGRAPADPTDTRVGPVRVEVVEPLRVLRVTADDPELSAELTFTGRVPPVEEPRQTMWAGTRLMLDTWRFTQFGRWTGTLSVDGRRIELTDVPGTRDRSWGVRPLAGPAVGAPPTELPTVFWLWAPLQLTDRCVHVAIMEDPVGRRHTDLALVLPDGAEPLPQPSARYRIDWEPGTRRAQRAAIELADGSVYELEPAVRFLLRGLGYGHPEAPHGAWHGESWTSRDRVVIADLDPLDATALHIQQACRVSGAADGVGVLEQLCLGPHRPSGLVGFLDGAD